MSNLARYFEWDMGTFDDLMGDLFGWSEKKAVHNSAFRSDVPRDYSCSEDDERMVITFDLPGVKPKDVKVEAEGSQLSVRYSSKGKDMTARFTVRREYEPSKTTAKLVYGVLELNVPRSDLSRAKVTIEVKGE